MSPASLALTLAAARSHQLSSGSLHVLTYLASHESATLGDLRKALNVTTSAITGLSDRTVALGYATRRACDLDRRIIRLDITPSGHAAIQRILQGQHKPRKSKSAA